VSRSQYAARISATKFARLAPKALERLFERLVDASRRDSTMLLLLAGYTATWSLYGTIARSSQDLHPDMTELVAWSRDLSFGYLKHPPLAAWLVGDYGSTSSHYLTFSTICCRC
jgi:hypothetical protein